MAKDVILINRAPVLTLWAAVVAQRLGFDHDAALTLGMVASSAAHASYASHRSYGCRMSWDL